MAFAGLRCWCKEEMRETWCHRLFKIQDDNTLKAMNMIPYIILGEGRDEDQHNGVICNDFFYLIV